MFSRETELMEYVCIFTLGSEKWKWKWLRRVQLFATRGTIHEILHVYLLTIQLISVIDEWHKADTR